MWKHVYQVLRRCFSQVYQVKTISDNSAAVDLLLRVTRDPYGDFSDWSSFGAPDRIIMCFWLYLIVLDEASKEQISIID